MTPAMRTPMQMQNCYSRFELLNQYCNNRLVVLSLNADAKQSMHLYNTLVVLSELSLIIMHIYVCMLYMCIHVCVCV